MTSTKNSQLNGPRKENLFRYKITKIEAKIGCSPCGRETIFFKSGGKSGQYIRLGGVFQIIRGTHVKLILLVRNKWNKCFKLVFQVVKGLRYLWELKIMHRGKIKASNLHLFCALLIIYPDIGSGS